MYNNTKRVLNTNSKTIDWVNYIIYSFGALCYFYTNIYQFLYKYIYFVTKLINARTPDRHHVSFIIHQIKIMFKQNCTTYISIEKLKISSHKNHKILRSHSHTNKIYMRSTTWWGYLQPSPYLQLLFFSKENYFYYYQKYHLVVIVEW